MIKVEVFQCAILFDPIPEDAPYQGKISYQACFRFEPPVSGEKEVAGLLMITARHRWFVGLGLTTDNRVEVINVLMPVEDTGLFRAMLEGKQNTNGHHEGGWT